MVATTCWCKYPNNHCSHCNIDDHTEEKRLKLCIELTTKNINKYNKKKNLMAIVSIYQVQITSYVDDNIVCTLV